MLNIRDEGIILEETSLSFEAKGVLNPACIKKDGYVFDISFTSMLKRSIRSLGIPLVYELNQMLKPLDKYYLSEDKKVEEAIEFIKNQHKIFKG